jgi:outer membrane protein OmpA-like peptidoglycan-associated protein
MRYPFIAGVALSAIATACSSVPAVKQPASPTAASSRVEQMPNEDHLTAMSHPAADEVAPEPAGKSAEQMSIELQERLAAKKREGDAQQMLAANAAVKVDFGGLVITLSDSALFAPEGAALLTSSQPMMQKIAGALLVTKGRELVVEGHMDSDGTPSGLIELSRQRAEAVRAYLIAQGYPAGLIRAQGIGQDRPVATNASAQGREKNRRMEIVVSVKQDEAL